MLQQTKKTIENMCKSSTKSSIQKYNLSHNVLNVARKNTKSIDGSAALGLYLTPA